MGKNVKRKRIFLSPPHMGREEMRFVKEAFESNYIAPLGPQVDAFEKEFAEYIGIRYCLALSSGTAAMHLALEQLGIGPGDEVFASTLTFIGSVTPITFQGATPVFIDADKTSWNMDPALLERELKVCSETGKLPKAVIPTDLYGQCCDYDHIFEICDRYGVPVVMDAAEACGAQYLTPHYDFPNLRGKQRRKGAKGLVKNFNKGSFLGDLGDFARGKSFHSGKGAKASIYSFNGNKIMSTSGGGMLASDDEELIDYARFLSQQARDPAPHYEHSTIGYNYRMSNVVAAIGRGQLRVLDERVKRKREIFDYYRDALGDVPGIEFMPEPDWSRSNRWLTVILITPEEFGVDREAVRLALEEENIESRPVWKPMHMQPVFDCAGRGARGKRENAKRTAQGNLIQNSKFKIKKYPSRVVGGKVSEDLFERGLCLPSGTAMINSDMDRVINTILKCRSRAKAQRRKERRNKGHH